VNRLVNRILHVPFTRFLITPDNLVRCVLTPLCSRKRKLRPNFPLSTYSVFAEKNVSQKVKSNLPDTVSEPAVRC